MRIFCTGVGGFVMSNAYNHLHAEKLDMERGDVHGCDNFSFGFTQNIDAHIPFDMEDFKNYSENYLNTFDVLIHGATSNIIYSQSNELETFKNNAVNTLKLFQKFKGKIIYLSTASVYNNATVIPTPETYTVHTVNAYDNSKLIAEIYLQERGNYTTLRLSNVYGINQRPDSDFCGVIGRMIYKALRVQPIEIIGDGTSTRDYTFVSDVVEAIVKAVDLPAMNTEINIASQRQFSAIDLVNVIHRQIKDAYKLRLPLDIYIPNRSIDTISRRCLDISKAKELLEWSPEVSLEEGIENTIVWMKGEYSL